MKCISCKNGELMIAEKDKELIVKECNSCKGFWIPAFNYAKYSAKHPPLLRDKNIPEYKAYKNEKDTAEAKICPDCGRITEKAIVGYGMDFYIDRCPHCHGIWLDDNEWNKLVENSLENMINYMFSESWKRRSIEYLANKKWADNIVNRIGDGTFLKVLDIIEWLKSQDYKDDILAFMLNEIKGKE